MSVLKIVTNPYDSPEAATALINYIYRKSYCIGGLGVDPKYAVEHMEMVRQMSNQTGGRQMYHFIVAFDYKESTQIRSAESLLYTAYEICEHFAEQHQIVFGIHRSDYRWHIHFAMNPVSFMTGWKYRADKQADFELGCVVRGTTYVNTLWTTYGARETLDDIEL